MAVLVASGATVQIRYTDGDAGDIAMTTIYADRDGDLATTPDQVVIDSRPDGNGATQIVSWNTAGSASGTYSIFGVCEDGITMAAIAEAAGTVQINNAPSVSISAPATDSVVQGGTAVQVAYADNDADDTATTDLFADADGNAGTTADQLPIATDRAEQGGTTQLVAWDTTGIAAGTYFVVAVTADGVNAAATAVSSGAITITDAGDVGNAIHLLGDGGHVTFPSPLLGARTTFTFEMWINLSYPPIVGAPQPTRNLIYVESYVGGGPLNGAQRNFTFVSLDDDGVLDETGSVIMVSWPNDGLAYTFTDPAPQGEWMHLAFVRTGSTLRIFVNGTLAAEGGALTYTGPTPTEFHLGLFVNPVSGNEWGKFVVDEVRVSSIARYDADFAPARVFAPDASTISLWHFDEAAGATTSDAAGNEPDATLVGGAVRATADR